MSIIHAITITQETRFAGLGVWVIGDGAWRLLYFATSSLSVILGKNTDGH